MDPYLTRQLQPILTPDDHATVSRERLTNKFVVGVGVGLWLTLWLLRSRRDDTRMQDLYVFVSALTWQNRESLGAAFASTSQLPSLPFLLTLLVCCATSWIISNTLGVNSEPPECEAPWLLPSRTSHTRLFPKRHSFAYSLLQVAVPVGSEGLFGSLISIGNVERKGWYHVQASDYLERNSREPNLKSKLRMYLKSQSVKDTAWSYAYLITAPRFLGYAFNPVSFWYIYTSQHDLTMMILEVNNTFDERRMYLLQARDPEEKSEDSHSSNPPTPGAEVPIALPKGVSPDGKFKQAWTKDFHVSPFNSRKGYYMLTAVDPFAKKTGEATVFSNTITLRSSKDHVKLIARVFSNGKPINPVTSTWQEMINFVLPWFWIGFLTFPRILKEAAVLFWSRGLHVWLRPEVMASSIGRREDRIETDLAPFFESYLQSLVAQHPTPIRVLYTSNIDGSLPRNFSNLKSNIETKEFSSADNLEMRVLSPVFFARFVHYAHSSEAFDRECTFTDEKNRTIWLSRPDLMYRLLKPSSPPTYIASLLSPLQRLRWNVHKVLRCPPAAPVYSSLSSTINVEDIRKSTLSQLDRYVMCNMKDEAARYRRLCARLFLAQRMAFGFSRVVDLLDFAIRVGLVWYAAGAAGDVSRGALLKPAVSMTGACIWAFLKGT